MKGFRRLISHIRHHHQMVFLDYPVKSRPRYGYGRPPHPELYELLSSYRSRYRAALQKVLPWKDDLASIPTEMDGTTGPAWVNGYLSGLDAVSLYGMLSEFNPARYVEIGSGHSTRFARRAIRDRGLRTRIESIDPHPRAEIDSIADSIIRSPLENLDLSLVTSLNPGDVLFIDGSHRCFMNSDVTVAFLEILPRLQAGVRVHLHDIFLPYDYPADWVDTYYSEQYVLGAFLLGGAFRMNILLANGFVSEDPELSRILDPIWDGFESDPVTKHGCSFWFQITDGATGGIVK